MQKYRIWWRKRDGGEETRLFNDINKATDLKNYLLRNNVVDVDLAVVAGNDNHSSMFPANKKYQFKKMP